MTFDDPLSNSPLSLESGHASSPNHCRAHYTTDKDRFMTGSSGTVTLPEQTLIISVVMMNVGVETLT